MPSVSRLSRRDFLIATSAALAPNFAFGNDSSGSVASTTSALSSTAPDVEIELIAKRDNVRILEGASTPVWRYIGNLIKGPQNTLSQFGDSYLGPTMRFVKGQRIRIHLRNELPQQTIAHWHGLHVPMAADGHPMSVIDPGQSYIYDFEMLNRASMNFYHPHPHEETATQVYRGLAGLIIVEDDEERALGLPSGEYEIPLVIQDRAFNAANQLVYGGGMHRSMFGFYGDQILVNGKPNYRLEVASRAYRLRLLNASNARIYKLGWDDGEPITVIGVDGGLLNKPETRPYLMLAPSERVDLWVDFSSRPVGSKLIMRNMSFSGLIPEMAMGMMQDDGLSVSENFPLFTVVVTRKETESLKLPQLLSNVKRFRIEDAVNPTNPVPIAIAMQHMSFTLNGREYSHDDILPRERIPVDTVQLIDIFHDHGGMGMHGGMMGGGMGMMSMAHPIHLHGQSFQIISRTFEGNTDSYATVRDGFIDVGLKDTVIVSPGERIRIVKPFNNFKGRFMYHCHNLEHEDMGMMREFLVE